MVAENILFKSLLLINSVYPIEARNTGLPPYCERADTAISYEESGAKNGSLDHFCNMIESWKDEGHPSAIVGFFVPGVGIYKVVQQPEGNPEYVSAVSRVFTQFGMAEKKGVIGLLSHANIDGERVVGHMKVDDIFAVSNGLGEIHWFQVNEVDVLNTVTPDDAHSDFIDPLSGKILSVERVFERYYTDSSNGEQKAILQTCVYDEKMVNIGREFVEAREIDEPEIVEGNVLNSRSNIAELGLNESNLSDSVVIRK